MTTKVNKTAIVRNLLKEIGAISENPPQGWRQQVEAALAKQNLEMHQVSIYQIRNSEMKKATGAVATPKQGRPKASTKPDLKLLGAAVSGHVELSVADLKMVQELAKNLGGLDALSEAITAIKSFQG